jgi:tetratricopeptide (TPR) repeat protein
VVRGTERLARGDIGAAELYLNKALEVAPGDAAADVRLAAVRMAQKRPADAEKLYQTALERDPGSMEALRGLAGLALQQKQPEKALAEVEAQIARSPKTSGFYFLQAQLLLPGKDPGRAEAAAQKAVDLDPNNVEAVMFLAQLQVQRGATEQAIAEYQKALQTNPRAVPLYVAEGSAEEARGNWQQAETLDRQALQIQSDYPPAANNLAATMMAHGGDKAVALTMAQTARRGMPQDPHTADTLGWAFYNNGVYGSAIELLREAVKTSPEKPTYHYHLGLAYLKQDDSAHAKEEFQRALQLKPVPAQADEIRKVLAESAGG